MIRTIWTWTIRALALLNIEQALTAWVWQRYGNPEHVYRPLPFWAHRFDSAIVGLAVVYLPFLLLVEIGVFVVGRKNPGRFLLSASLLVTAALLSMWQMAEGMSHLR